MKCPMCGANIPDDANQCSFCGSDLGFVHYLRRVSGTFYNAGLERAKVRDLTGAAEALNKALRYDKSNKDARNLLGLIYYEIGEITKALSEWVLSKYLNPENNAADYFIETLQSNQVAVDSASQSIKKYNAALESARSGNTDLAIIQLKKVVSLSPRFIRASQLLALLYMRESDYAKAEKCLLRIKKIDTGNTRTMQYLRELYEITGGGELTDRPRKPKSKKDPLENVQPVGTYREEKKSLLPFIYIVIGLAIGIAVTFVLIRPTMEKINRESGSEIAQTNDQLSVKESRITALESEKKELQAQIDALNEQIKSAEKLSAEESANYEKLLKAVGLYIADDKLGAAIAVGECSKKDFKLKEAQGLYTTVSTISEEDLSKLIADARETINTDYSAALKQLKSINNIVKDNQTVLYLMARCYHYMGKLKKAKTYYEKTISIQAGTEEAVQADRYLTELGGGTPATTREDLVTSGETPSPSPSPSNESENEDIAAE